MACVGINFFFSMDFIEEMCMIALAPRVITISGSTFDPSLIVFSMRDLYFSIFVVIDFFFKTIIIVCKFNELNFKVVIVTYWWI